MDKMDNWITVDDAEKISGYDQNHIRMLARVGKVAGRKFGNTWQIDKDSILKYAKGRDERAHMPKNLKTGKVGSRGTNGKQN
ncbi:MAG: hypothetical protein CNIPEHKO_00795 [Anaerolineales bacterium]|nr:hypothetical protein [Anaerolineales bacterium]